MKKRWEEAEEISIICLWAGQKVTAERLGNDHKLRKIRRRKRHAAS